MFKVASADEADMLWQFLRSNRL